MLAAGAVVEAVSVPTATAQRLFDAQQRSEELQALLDDKFRSVGEPGIARPKDVLLFVNDLEYKENAKENEIYEICPPCILYNTYIYIYCIYIVSRIVLLWFRQALVPGLQIKWKQLSDIFYSCP